MGDPDDLTELGVEKVDETDSGDTAAPSPSSPAIVINEISSELWYAAPDFVLLNIKKWLDYSNNVRLDAVCKPWSNFSKENPRSFFNKSEVENYPPWIMRSELGNEERNFTKLTSNENFTLVKEDFVNSDLLYSKEGWFFMMKIKRDMVNSQPNFPFFITQVFRNDTIELPALHEETGPLVGTFTLKEEYPYRVVLLKNFVDANTITLYHTKVGDPQWITSSYTNVERIRSNVPWVFLVNENVYSIDKGGSVFEFNMSNSTWKELILDSFGENFSQQFLLEHKEEIFRVAFKKRLNSWGTPTLRLYKYKLEFQKEVYWASIGAFPSEKRFVWFLKKYKQGFVSDVKRDFDFEMLQNKLESMALTGQAMTDQKSYLYIPDDEEDLLFVQLC